MTRARRPAVVGILNVTPDSFSDGGRFAAPAVAVEHGLAMLRAGADWIDVGGESTRPGADLVDAAEEAERVVPVVRALVAAGALVSVDTRKAEVAQAALRVGARMVNDVSGGLFDPAILAVTAAEGAFFVAMHMRGTPADMATHAHYDDVVAEVLEELGDRMDAARSAGIAADKLIADPGFGFAKELPHNLELLSRLAELAALEVPLFVGVSRKSMVGALTGTAQPADRLAGSLAALTVAVLHGASYLRVHDVSESLAAVRVAVALRR
ncbi:MAG: dihydropteroate synthase [Planctomycetes bacterium]|nr:dihydropteroate synthase [Planctomycetota bacterium]